MKLPTLAECKKFLVAALGVIVMVLNAGLVTGCRDLCKHTSGDNNGRFNRNIHLLHNRWLDTYDQFDGL